MATSIEDETKDCIFQWKIENASNCWWLKFQKEIRSPTFIADALIGTKWSLWLYPMGFLDKNWVIVFLQREEDCRGPDVIEVNFKFAFLGKDDTILLEESIPNYSFQKGDNYGYLKFEMRERVFVTEREAFLPDDTLTVQCTLRKIDKKLVTNYLYGRTALKVERKYFIWRMENFSTNESGLRKNFKGNLFEFDLVLNEDCDGLNFDIISNDVSVEYISFNTSVINLEGKKEHCGIKNYSVGDLQKGVLSPVVIFPKTFTENKSRYLSNDTLSLAFEIAFSYVEHFEGEKSSSVSKKDVTLNECNDDVEKCQNSAILINDLKSLYNDGIFSDMELRTSTKSFPAHKGILSARSPVLRRMFSNDMKEANSGHVDIADFEGDTVQRMLLYIYTGTLQDLRFENASELYKIADKYEILSLQNKCSDYLKDNLCTAKVCDVLILADLHQDEDLKSAAQDYILDHNEVFKSLEWENFMKSNITLAADIMYMKVNSDKVSKGTQ